MSYEEFLEKVKENIKDYLPKEYAEAIPEVRKNILNNGRTDYGIHVRKEGEGIAPFLYLERYYKKIQQGLLFDHVIKEIAATYYQRDLESQEIKRNYLTYENVKDKIFVEACNAQKNHEMLKNVPHEYKENLALKYYIRQDYSNGDVGIMSIRNVHLKLWGLSYETLKAQAWKNMRLFNGPVIFPLDGLLDIFYEENQSEKPNVNTGLYVLTNRAHTAGAVYMCDKTIMEMLAERLEDDVIILPSSVDEVLLLKKSEVTDLQMIKEAVEEINSTMLSEEEFLSDEIYLYEKDTHQLSIIDVGEQELGMSMNM